MLLHQGIPLAQFISCPICLNGFNEKDALPISLACGHTVCKACTISKEGDKKCPFDQIAFPSDVEKLPANYALMQVMGATIPEQDRESPPSTSEKPRSYLLARQCIEDMAVHLKPLTENCPDEDPKAPLAGSFMSEKSVSKCILSRPIQRKLISLIHCQLLEEEGRSRSARMARSIGERIVTELLSLQHYPQQLSANLWAAVRTRGCQFLGPAMQEEVLKLILLALEDGSFLSRKVLVLFVVQRLETRYPQASKTAIGHVVQLLYRASCFKVMKRDGASSLMQLKDEFRQYELLRKEHDAQIVQIALEAGLRIPPEHWSSLLYGDSTHKSHMQSVIDKHQSLQSFSQCITELMTNLQRNGDPCDLARLRPQLEFLSGIDPSPDCPAPSWENLEAVMRCLNLTMKAFVSFLSGPDYRLRLESLAGAPNTRYKTSLCRDFAVKGMCPRGGSCTFAHSQDELDRHRVRSKRSGRKAEEEDNCDSPTLEEVDLMSQLHLNHGTSQPLPSPIFANPGQSNFAGSRPETQALTAGSSRLTATAPTAVSEGSPSSPSLAASTRGSSPASQPAPASLATPSRGPTLPTTLPQNMLPAAKMGPAPLLPSTKLTFSEPAKEVPETTFYPPQGPQTSLHPHNAASLGGHIVAPACAYGAPGLAPAYPSAPRPHQPWLEPCPATAQRPPYHPAGCNSAKLMCQPPCQAPPAAHLEAYGAPCCSCGHYGYVGAGGDGPAMLYPCSACQPPAMHCPQVVEGPDSALQSLNEAGLIAPGGQVAKEISLEYLTSRKKELICHLQEEPTFLDPMAQVYRADSMKGGFAGLKTVLGHNQRKKEPMPTLVSDMFVATRSTQSLDMFMYEDSPVYQTQWSTGDDKQQVKDGSSYAVMDGSDRKNPGASSVCTSTRQEPFVCSQVERSQPAEIPKPGLNSLNQPGYSTLYNSLGSSFTTCVTEALLLQATSDTKSCPTDTEFSRFPNDDDETIIPFEHTSVSKFGPISRMARVKTNNCAPVQVTADSSKRTTPVLAITPLERPMPISIPATSHIGSTTAPSGLMAKPAVKPTPTEAPSIWQESPQPSFMNIARLKAGAAGAISNNERLAYELQAVELQISLKTGKVPEPVGKIIQKAVMGNLPPTRDSSLMSMQCPSSQARAHDGDPNAPIGLARLSHGHITNSLTMIEQGKSLVSSEQAARHIMEEYQYQRSFQGMKK